MTEDKEKIKETYKEQFKEVIKDLKTPGKRKKQIPNILTASRLASPLLIIPAAIVGNVGFAVGTAIVFGLTDFFDGKLARKWGVKSQFGADLDAVTDKLFASTLLFAGAIFNPLLVANITLEAFIAGINVKEKLAGNKPASTKTGKVKTGFIFALGALGILAPAVSMPPMILPSLALATATLQGATALSYLKKYKEKKTPINTKKLVVPVEIQNNNFENKLEDTKQKTKERTYEIEPSNKEQSLQLTNQFEQLIDEALLEETKAPLLVPEAPKELIKIKTN